MTVHNKPAARSRHFQRKTQLQACRNDEKRKLSTEVLYGTHHLAALVHLLGDAAQKWTAGGALVKGNVGVSEALFDHVHDFGNNVANIGVLWIMSAVQSSESLSQTYVGVDTSKYSFEPDKPLRCFTVQIR